MIHAIICNMAKGVKYEVRERDRKENAFLLKVYRTNLLEKLDEALKAVAPILVIVLLLCFTIAPLPTGLLTEFLIGAVLLLAGMINNVSVLIQNKHVSLVTNAVLVTQLTDGAVIQVNKYHTVTVPCAVEIMDLPA